MKAGALALVLALLSGPLLASDECGRLYRERLASDLSLSYEDFDQAQGKGFRALQDAGCLAEAAMLIEDYLAAHPDTRGSSVEWHLAQIRAELGDYPAAIRAARASRSPSENFEAFPLRWNDYVDATIAFLERDKPALMAHRDRVAEGAEAFWGNQLNLKLLDSLIRNYEQDYRYAVTHIE